MQRLPSSFAALVTPPQTLLKALLALPLALLLAPSPSRASVCYSAQARGLTISRYQVDTLTSGWRSASIDFGSNPWEINGSEFLDYARPDVFAAFIRRYGPYTACLGGLASLPECDGHVFKRFAGPGNEVRSFVADALTWWSSAHPANLGGDSTCHSDGIPSEREITDVQAVSDNAIWERYHSESLPGGNATRPLSVCRTDRAHGAFAEVDPFWGWTNYFFNTCSLTPDPTPTTPQPVQACAKPPQAVLEAARRVRNRSSAKAAGQVVIDWLTAARSCAAP